MAADGTKVSKVMPVSVFEDLYAYPQSGFTQFPRRYTASNPAETAHACEAGLRVDVRFQDAFRCLADKTGAFRRIGFQSYLAGELLETESGLFIAVPYLHYAHWLEEPLRRARALKDGESFIIEGVAAGLYGGKPLVYADRILTLDEGASEVQRKITIQGPVTTGEPALTIDTPGTRSVSVPVSATRTMNLTVVVESIPRPEILAWWKNLLLPNSEVISPTISYQAVSADQWSAVSQGRDVCCSGRVRSIGLPPQPLANIKISEDFMLESGAYLLLEGDIPCLVPRGEAVLIERASRVLPGQNLDVEGTVLAQSDAGPILLIHDFQFNQIPVRPESVPEWRVTINRDGFPSRILYMPGKYQLLWEQEEESKNAYITITLNEFRAKGH